MSEHGRPEGQAVVPTSGLAKSAASIDAFMKPINTWLGYLGAVSLGVLVLVMVWAILGRRFFNAPLQGSTEITQLGLVFIIALVFGIEHTGHEKMTVDILIKHFPARVQAFIAPIVYLLGIVIFCVVIWQLIVLGNTYRDAGQTMRNITMPIYPFTYLLVLAFVTLIPTWVARFLRAVDRVVTK